MLDFLQFLVSQMPSGLTVQFEQLLFLAVGAALSISYQRLTGKPLPQPTAIPNLPTPVPSLPTVPAVPSLPLPDLSKIASQGTSSAESLLVAGGHPIAAMLLQWLTAALKTGLPAAIAANAPPPSPPATPPEGTK